LPKNVKFLPKYFFVYRKSSNFVPEIVKQTVKNRLIMTTNLTNNEQVVLKAIVENARNVGDSSIEFIMSDVARITGKSQKSIQGVCSSLKKKGFLQCYNCEAYFDGEIYPIAEEWYNKTFGEKKEEITEEDDNTVVDQHIVRLNEILSTKLASVGGKKREELKVAKTAAKYILENWDNAELGDGGLKVYLNDDEMRKQNEELYQIAESRYCQLVKFAAKDIEEKVLKSEIELSDAEESVLEVFVVNYGKTTTEIKEEVINIGATSDERYDSILVKLQGMGLIDKKGATHAGRKVYDCLVKKNASAKAETTPTSTESKKESKTTSTTKKTTGTARKVGDHHPTKPWIWTEYAPGKFDWRTDKTMTGEKKVVVKKETKKAEPKKITTEEFVGIATKNKRKLSATQAEYLKLLKKGYWIWNNGGHYFFKNEEGKMKQCNMDSLKSLFKKFNIEEIPSCLIR
jgi:hypothetical protein